MINSKNRMILRIRLKRLKMEKKNRMKKKTSNKQIARWLMAIRLRILKITLMNQKVKEPRKMARR
jgi:hypothetical protein